MFQKDARDVVSSLVKRRSILTIMVDSISSPAVVSRTIHRGRPVRARCIAWRLFTDNSIAFNLLICIGLLNEKTVDRNTSPHYFIIHSLSNCDLWRYTFVFFPVLDVSLPPSNPRCVCVCVFLITTGSASSLINVAL